MTADVDAKIVIVTDLHITAPDETIIGLDPSARLNAVLDHAAKHHADASLLVAMGDLTHHGRPDEYAQLIKNMPNWTDQIPCPLTLMLGNHDRRAPFLDAFAGAQTTPSGHVQTCVDLGPWRVITLDSLDDPQTGLEHSGYLCADRLDWLAERLAEAPDQRAIVFIHHPPFDTGFDGMDGIKLRNGDDLMAVLKASGRVEMLICGHVHRTIFTTFQGIPAAVLKSPCHQMPMALGPASIHLSVDEPGAYGVLLLTRNGPILHSEDVLPERTHNLSAQ